MSYEQEVLAALKPFANAETAVIRKHYMGTKLDVLGLTVPQQRAVAKHAFSFYQKSPAEILSIWDGIWKTTKWFEVRSLALLYYDEKEHVYGLKEWSVLRHWVDQVDNWAHSDSLASVFAELHERYPDRLYPVYERWIKDKNPWRRRAALTGLLYYSSQRETYPSFEKIMAIVSQAVGDKEIYVQKAVGWTLRECFNVYPEETFEKMLAWAAIIHPAAWYAVNEKLTLAQKKRLKEIRKMAKADRNTFRQARKHAKMLAKIH